MADVGVGGFSSGPIDTGLSAEGMESSDGSMENGVEGTETGETELYSDDCEQELYSLEYDSSEYESELLTYEFTDEKGQEYLYEEDSSLRFNEDGDPVDDVPVVADESFIVRGENYAETGEWSIDWSSKAENADDEGFNKDMPVTVETLQPDTVISRYGSERGRYGTDKGTEYSELSLPYDPKSQEYHEYRVIEPVSCKKGTAAKNFGQKGGGTQYVFTDTFSEMSDPSNPNRTMERIR